jgi:PAS domain S-box-containing protein
MARKKYKFESELHLGLLVIVFVLLALNMVSNYVVFRARVTLQETGLADLSTASLGIGRVVQQSSNANLTLAQTNEFMSRYRLSDLIVAPVLSSKDPVAMRAWFRSSVRGLPPDRVAALSDQLLKAQPNKLVRGNRSEYLFVRPVAVGGGERLVILSKEYPELAYLEDSGRLLLLIGEIGLAVVALVYLLVSRFVLSPFRKLKQQAIAAGRSIDNSKDEVEQVVSEYERIIADLKQSEAELRSLNISIQERADSLEEFNRYLLAAIDSGVVTLDMDGRILTVSAAATRMLGLEPDSIVGQNFEIAFARICGMREAVSKALTDLRQTGYREYECRTGDSETRVVGATISHIRDHTKRPIGVLILLNDLTELSSLRHQVEQKNRLEALGEMAGGLAHQLRNSLGAIVGFGTLTKKRTAKGETDQSLESAESLLREAREAEELVSRFLTFARPLDYRPSTVLLATLAGEIIESFRQRQDCSHISFRLSCPEGVAIAADAVLLKQAIANLIENAVHAYGGAGGAVEVVVDRDATQVRIRVSDSGSGIHPDHLEKIFTPFYSSRPSGTGLGLPLARRIVDLHGGQITVDTNVGKGTTFNLIIPIAATAAVTSSAYLRA